MSETTTVLIFFTVSYQNVKNSSAVLENVWEHYDLFTKKYPQFEYSIRQYRTKIMNALDL